MLLRSHKSGFLLILAFCFFKNISPSPPRGIRQNAVSNGTIQTTTNQTGLAPKVAVKLTESFLPPVMQAIAHYIELLQYEPAYSTTVEPPFTLSTTPLTLPAFPSAGTPQPPPQQPVTWWSPPSTTTTQRPSTWWSPPSTTTKKPPSAWWNPSSTTTTQRPWWMNDPTGSSTIEESTVSSTQTSEQTTTRKPLVSTTTPAYWHHETTPFHKPGYFAPDESKDNDDDEEVTSKPITKPTSKPQLGDLSFLSISSFPHFEYFVKPNSKSFVKKPEYEYLHQYPAELLQDIENEPNELTRKTDQEKVDEFRRVYDDFFSRVRVYSPITGKKRVPPTRPYVLFLIFYDVCKREAKRLALQEFTGYSQSMLQRLHETSKYSAERQLYTLLDELAAQKSIVANDFIMRMNEIMTDLSNPNSVTAKALHILPTLKFEF